MTEPVSADCDCRCCAHDVADEDVAHYRQQGAAEERAAIAKKIRQMRTVYGDGWSQDVCCWCGKEFSDADR